jgi:hypothetical protein
MIRAGKAVVSLAFLCAVLSYAVAEEPDVLRRSYESVPERAALLRQARRHLDELTRLAENGELKEPLTRYEGYMWLVRHRIPATLVVERALPQAGGEGELDLLLSLAVHIGHGRLLEQIPPLLPRATTQRGAHLVMRTLARIRTAEALQALRTYIHVHGDSAPDPLLATAALGLGHTRQTDHLPLLQALSRKMKSPAARVRVAAARCLCGDDRAGSYLLDVMANTEADGKTRLAAVELSAECNPDGAARVLASLARQHAEDRLGTAAFRALLTVTGFLEPRLGAMPPPDFEEEEETVEPVTHRWSEGTEAERISLVDEVMSEFRTRPAAEVAAPDGPPPAQ